MSQTKKSPAENIFPEEKFSKTLWDFMKNGAILSFSHNAQLNTAMLAMAAVGIAVSYPALIAGSAIGIGVFGRIEIEKWKKRRIFIKKAHGNRMEKAADFINNNGTAELAQLSTAGRQELLINSFYADDEKLLHEKIYKASAKDTALSENDITKLKLFTGWYINSPLKDDAYGDWRQSRWEKLLPQIQIIADKHAEIFGYKSAKIEVFGGLLNPRSYGLLGRYNDSKNIIQLNLNSRNYMGFDNMVATLLHEATHAHQVNLIKSFQRGEIDKNNPDYQQIRGFAINDCRYVKGGAGDEGYNTYMQQYVEHHAFAAEEFFEKHINSKSFKNIFNSKVDRQLKETKEPKI